MTCGDKHRGILCGMTAWLYVEGMPESVYYELVDGVLWLCEDHWQKNIVAEKLLKMIFGG